MRTSFTRSLFLAVSMMILQTASHAAFPPPREVRLCEARFAQLAPLEQQQVLDLKGRLEVLVATDRTALDAEGRAELRAEWKLMKREMRAVNRNGSVIYISTAGLIIIVLLLIIIF